MDITDPQYNVKDFKTIKELYAAVCHSIEINSFDRISKNGIITPYQVLNFVVPKGAKNAIIQNNSYSGLPFSCYYNTIVNNVQKTLIGKVWSGLVETIGNQIPSKGSMTIYDVQRFSTLSIGNFGYGVTSSSYEITFF